MNPARPPQHTDSPGRQRAHRAARGLLAQYIHELSDRNSRAAPTQRLAARNDSELVELKEDG
jgi:hypothetical protein